LPTNNLLSQLQFARLYGSREDAVRQRLRLQRPADVFVINCCRYILLHRGRCKLVWDWTPVAASENNTRVASAVSTP